MPQTSNTVTSQQTTTASYTCENISPEGQTLILLSWNCKTSWQITHHLALITSYRNDTANEDILPVVRQYTLMDLGLLVPVVMAPTPIQLSPVVSYGVKNKTHSTVTHHLNLTANKGCFWHASSSDTTTQFKQTSSLHSCQTVDVHRQTAFSEPVCLSLGLVVFLSPCRSLQHKPHTYKSTCLSLHSSTADDTKPLETPKTLQTTFLQADALTCRHVKCFYSVKHWNSALEAGVSNTLSSSDMYLPPLVLPFHDSSSLFLSICDVFSLFFQSYDYCVIPSVWCRLALCL